MLSKRGSPAQPRPAGTAGAAHPKKRAARRGYKCCGWCLPSLWVFGERIPTPGTTADAELTRNGLIESVGNIDRCPVLAARPYSTQRAQDGSRGRLR
ncbi:unnamed protein product [Rangifer tarandus platyrhynchus]|uniref:Uncharacterized protein n=3 Tax=Rangifer tarandus platyrhynchus TaxID=3082113 RepID=A0ABN8Y4M0_RANTA|nr:unnamed protein product [Rangifer tarandus platyrhynchus]CAI9693009.1 unnamed protein product [Rangifer tarandus platyrhynchus]